MDYKMAFPIGYNVWILIFVVVNAQNEVVEEHAGPSTDCTKSTRDESNSSVAINGSTCSLQRIGCGKQLACDRKLFDSIPVEYPHILDVKICSLNLSNNLISDIPNKAFHHSGLSTFTGLGEEMKMLKNLRSLSMSPSPRAGHLFFEKEFLELKNLVNISFYDMFGDCKIYNISDKAFQNVPYVKVLNLDNCHIKTIGRQAFKPMNSSLHALHLSQNENLKFSDMNDALAGLENSSALITLRANQIHHFSGLAPLYTEIDGNCGMSIIAESVDMCMQDLIDCFQMTPCFHTPRGKASFIKSSVVPSLEHIHDLSLWIHDRDSAAGESVAENITHAIGTSS
ncbi:hypothetical protein MAR_028130 [Mya arenaria]|uniref:Uncharacterized protein n=1 Tax=Mya arenaria TaxID=6604 RepID=A0ABY7DGH9_MYAAR|nr:hypothetical protein MAR_028130 [Mya arenaria]